jgi:photosystem II stability/assembly factor-like uncharacterized protein
MNLKFTLSGTRILNFSELKLIHFLVIIVTLFLLPCTVSGQWSQTSGPSGGRAHDVKKVNDEYWVASNFGIYVSSNEGGSWTIHPNFTNVYSNDLLISGDSIIVIYTTNLSDDADIFCKTSFNGGQTWNQPVIVPFDGYYTGEIGALHQAGATIYLTEFFPYNFVSYDFGQTWEIFTFPYYDNITFKAFGNTGTVVNNYDSDIQKFMYYYKDEALQTWNLLDSALFDAEVLVKDSFIYFTITSNDFNTSTLVRTEDIGLTWDTVASYTDTSHVEGDLYNFENKLYLNFKTSSYLEGQFISYTNRWTLSEDNGTTWQEGEIPSVLKIYYNSVLLSTGEALAATHLGMSRYTTDASNSFPVNTGFIAHGNLLFENNGTLFSACDYNTFRSTDGGATWNELPIIESFVRSFAFAGDTIFGISEYPSLLLKSFDNGISWDTITLPFWIGTFQMYSIVELNQRIFINTMDSIKYSDNYGLTWQGIAPWPDPESGYPRVGILKKLNNEIYCISSGGSIAKLNTSNLTWTVLNDFSSISGYTGNTLYAFDQTLIASGYSAFSYSNDAGATWISPALNGIPLDEFGDPYSPRNVVAYQGTWFCTMGSYGVYFSTDMGENWQQIQNPSPFVASGGLVFLNNILYSGSYNSGVWRRASPFATITGNVYRDLNNNGIKDGIDYNLPEVLVKTSPQTFIATSNSAGNYSLVSDVVGDTLKLVLPNNSCVSNPNYYITNGNASAKNFGVYIDSNINDLSIDLTNVNVFRPGFETQLILKTKNNGAEETNATIKLELDSQITFLNSTPPFNSQNGDTLIWISESLSFLESNTVSVQIYTPIFTNLGDSVKILASAFPVTNDATPINNYTLLSDIFVGSYDPNDKACDNGALINLDEIQNDELQYLIRFQNTGNFQADNVHVSDTLSEMLDLSTFRVISYSHPMRYDIHGSGVADFYFDNINLPDSNSNEPLSHGFVKYGVKCKSNLSLGNAITNTAYIYFDFNSPIITNTTTTLVTYPLFPSSFEEVKEFAETNILVYPNPANEYFTIEISSTDLKNLSVSIFNVTGSLLKSQRIETTQQISLQNFSSGIYFGIVTDENKAIRKTFKIIHQ